MNARDEAPGSQPKESSNAGKRKRYAEGMPTARSVAGETSGEQSDGEHRQTATEALAKLRAAGIGPVDFTDGRAHVITNPPHPSRTRGAPEPAVSEAKPVKPWVVFAVLYLFFAVVVALVLRARR